MSDGSRLAYLYPAGYRRKKQPERLLIRVIEYTIGDPARNGSHEVHRVATTLLNPRIAPALEVVLAYHERWEIEKGSHPADTSDDEKEA